MTDFLGPTVLCLVSKYVTPEGHTRRESTQSESEPEIVLLQILSGVTHDYRGHFSPTSCKPKVPSLQAVTRNINE